MNLSKIIGLIIVSLITLIIMTFLHYASFLLGFFVGFWIFMMFVVLLIIGIVVFIRHGQSYMLILSIINVLITILAWPIGSTLGAIEESVVTENAEKIIRILYDYKEKYNSFPDDIEKLYPEFINDRGIFYNISYHLFGGNFYLDLNTTNCGKEYRSADDIWIERPCP